VFVPAATAVLAELPVAEISLRGVESPWWICCDNFQSRERSFSNCSTVAVAERSRLGIVGGFVTGSRFGFRAAELIPWLPRCQVEASLNARSSSRPLTSQ
jgi:hypothetical protein